MYLVCPACSKRLQIPDDKLPNDRAVRVTCPACQERFSYDARATGASAVSPVDDPTTLMAPDTPFRRGHTELGNALLALICLDEQAHREMCQSMLMSLGYTAHLMANQVRALEALRQIPYRLFILDARFDGTSLDTNLVLTFLRERPLEQRRYLFVTLCDAHYPTGDSMVAYSQSANLVINHADVPNASAVLVQHLAEHERLYRVYRELRQHLGRDA